MPCYLISTEIEDGGVVIEGRVHADEVATDPETIAAIHAVVRAAYKQLKESDDPH